jgi:hypothetical protein
MIINESFKNEIAVVTSHGFSLSNEKKTPYIWFEFEFSNLRGANDEPVTVRADLYLSDAALDYTLEKLAVMGWNGKSVTELDPNEPDGHDFKGVRVALTGEMQEYNGKSRPKVSFINDPDYVPHPKIEPDQLKVLNAKLVGKIAAYRSKNVAPAKPKV